MKHIKKSMFISTVLMVVMLIAALSTATFAWYTSNNSVASTATQVGAAQSKSANIGIGWYRTATDSTITFDALVDSNSQGGMYPLAPKTFYEKRIVTVNNNVVTDTVDTTNLPADAYITTSISNVATGIIANAFDTNGAEEGGLVNSLRIINLAATKDVNDIYNANDNLVIAKATVTHDVTAETKIITNLKEGTTAGTLTGNYDIIYTSIKYAYNNNINQVANAPAANNIITLDAGQYTVATPSINDTACYTVYDVYRVSTTGSDTTPALNEENKDISQMLAYSLTGKACNPDTYVVAYIEYTAVPFNTVAAPATLTKIQAIDTSANAFIGYAANQANTANTGDIFKTEATAEYGVNGNINWNSNNGFAYLYKIYDAASPDASLTTAGDGDFYNIFYFSESNVDASGYFKSTSTGNITPVAFWSDGTQEDPNADVYGASKAPAIVTLRDTTAATATQSVFFVVNNSTDAEAVVNNLKVSINVSGDNADLLRIAVFKNGKYYGTLGKTAATHFGSVIEGANAEDMPTYDATTSINLGTLATGGTNAFQMRLVAWFDGKGLDDTAAGKNCSFTLSFEA